MTKGIVIQDLVIGCRTEFSGIGTRICSAI